MNDITRKSPPLLGRRLAAGVSRSRSLRELAAELQGAPVDLDTAALARLRDQALAGMAAHAVLAAALAAQISSRAE